MCTNHTIFPEEETTACPELSKYCCKFCGKSFRSFGFIFNVVGIAAIEENDVCLDCRESEHPLALTEFICQKHEILRRQREAVLFAVQLMQNKSMY